MPLSSAMIVSCLLIAGLGFAAELPPLPLIPQPAKVERQDGSFRLSAATRIAISGTDAQLATIADQLAGRLRVPTGFPLPVGKESAAEGAVTIACDGEVAALGNEGYRLTVDAHGVRIAAATPGGAFYGVQTLLQLLPVEAFSHDLETRVAWTIPCVTIEDRPRFRWRGLLLDTGRHFFGRDSVCRLLDEMALHKFNVLHLHLTEDQGWRIQIRRYPRLTELGATRASSPGDKGGPIAYGPYFYTQDDIRAIVAHASALHITVVPEIEMPGHSLAALACYPELSCTGGPFAVRTAWGVEPDVYCAGNDATFTFLENVLDEVMELFPGEYIHIGGDECPKQRWQKCTKCQARIQAEHLADAHDLQSWFIRRIARHLASKGRKLIGWDEILEGSPIEGATVTVWRNAAAGKVAAERGGDVIMCPTSHCYFDYRQANDSGSEPEGFGAVLSLETVFGFDPLPPGMPAPLATRVIGIQGNLWTESIASFRHLEYMAWPRGAALAEVAWSPTPRMAWNDFRSRLVTHLRRLDLSGTNYRHLDNGASEVVWHWSPKEVSETEKTVEIDLGRRLAEPGAYRFTFHYSGGKHRLDVAWAALLVAGKEVSRDAHAGSTGGSSHGNTYVLTVPEHPADAALVLRAAIRSDGGDDSHGELVISR